MNRQRWITVANRLPFSLSSDGKTLKTSSGGLVSALSGIRSNNERLWVGSAPEGLTQETWPSLEKRMDVNQWKYHPVFPAPELYDAYYNGFCNDVLWPLLHYQGELAHFRKDTWLAYIEMNKIFAREISAVAGKGDLIWIHDFHLFLLPRELKRLRPDLRVGFFLHVPFPSSEIFRQLPVREEILNSLLECDLVGFHDYAYLQHFASTVLRVLGIETSFLSVQRGERVTRLGVFPVGIDTLDFMRRSTHAKVRAIASAIHKDDFLFLGVDRLDYMKGIDLKLKAFGHLLRNFPEYRGHTSLLQVAVPTRPGVPAYMDLARETARLVGEINGEFSTPNWTPIQYIHSSIPKDQLLALYRAADALVVSSKRDGMNLVALEYIASQDPSDPGVVLLSEFAGAISTLSHTLSINPWDLDDSAAKMRAALEMPDLERSERIKTMQDYLKRYTSTDWASSFIAELKRSESVSDGRGPILLDVSHDSISTIRERVLMQRPKRMTIFVDYDGTIVPIYSRPEDAVLSNEAREQIIELISHDWLELVVVSGRDCDFLSKQFSGLRVRLACEHGAQSFDPIKGRWRRHVHRTRSDWYPAALKIMSDYADRVPGSRVEKKQFAIAWHYRLSPREYGEVQARKLAEELELGLANLPVSILRGKKVIEVRAIEADKGVFARAHLESLSSNTACLVMGDDATDEDLFRALRELGVTIRIGAEPSHAEFALRTQSEALPFLIQLVRSIAPRIRESEASTEPPLLSSLIKRDLPLDELRVL